MYSYGNTTDLLGDWRNGNKMGRYQKMSYNEADHKTLTTFGLWARHFSIG